MTDHTDVLQVVLDNDERLAARVPIYLPPGTTWRVAEDFQAIAVVPLRLHGTLVVDGTLVMM